VGRQAAQARGNAGCILLAADSAGLFSAEREPAPGEQSMAAADAAGGPLVISGRTEARGAIGAGMRGISVLMRCIFVAMRAVLQRTTARREYFGITVPQPPPFSKQGPRSTQRRRVVECAILGGEVKARWAEAGGSAGCKLNRWGGCKSSRPVRVGARAV